MCCLPLQGRKRWIRRRLKLMFTNSVVHETKRFHRDPSLSPAGRESTVLVPCSQNEKYDGKDENYNEVHYRTRATNMTGVDVVSEVQHESGIDQSSHYGGLAKMVSNPVGDTEDNDTHRDQHDAESTGQHEHALVDVRHLIHLKKTIGRNRWQQSREDQDDTLDFENGFQVH